MGLICDRRRDNRRTDRMSTRLPSSPSRQVLSAWHLRVKERPSHTPQHRSHHPYNSGTSHSLAMFSSKLTRAAHRATTLTNAAPAPAPWTASQCFATSTQRRPHQRRQSSSKASCPPDSSSKPAPAAKAAENTAQAADAEKTPRRASRIKRTQVEKSVKGKEEANQFAGLPTVPDTKHVGEKGTLYRVFCIASHTDILSRLLAFRILQSTPPTLFVQPDPPACVGRDLQQHFRVKNAAGCLGKRKLGGKAT